MAPVTRSSYSLRSSRAQPEMPLFGAQAPQQQTRSQRQQIEEESAPIESGADTEEDSLVDESSEDSEQDANMATPRLLTSADVQEALHPLRRAADRVGRQIEQFAEHLDKYKSKEASLSRAQKYKEACKLIKRYQIIAEDTVKELSDKAPALISPNIPWNKPSANDANALGSTPESKEADVQRWTAEALTWELFHDILNNDDPDNVAQSTKDTKNFFSNLSRYSTDQEIWEQFIATNQYARECVIALKWLEKVATLSSDSFEARIQSLEDEAERGSGLWAHGWLYTKEAIKAQRRLRTWPKNFEPSDPGLEISLVTSDGQALITQLDPDALSRQQRGLQAQDAAHEKATWMTCWQMLRQGKPWEDVASWAAESLEGWRAASFWGCVNDSLADSKSSSLFRFMNTESQNTWKLACQQTANDSTEPYQKAVYGLLCGDNDKAAAVCETWEDYMFVFFNGQIVYRYNNFVAGFQSHVGLPSKPLITGADKPYPTAARFIGFMKNLMKDLDDEISPFRSAQALLLARNFEEAYTAQGLAVSLAANAFEDNRLLEKPQQDGEADEASLIAAQDNDGLRFQTHMLIILHSLGYVTEELRSRDVVSSIPIGYMSLLLNAGKMELLPLYASQLPANIAASVLGRALVDVTDQEERQIQVTLIEELGISVGAVLEAQLMWAVNQFQEAEKSQLNKFTKPNILTTSVSDGRESSFVVRFIGDEITPQEDLMIRSIEWFQYAKDLWEQTCEWASSLYKHFFARGRLAAARELAHRFPLRVVSAKVHNFNLSVSGTVPDLDDIDEDADEEEAADLRKAVEEHSKLWEETRIFRELEQLVLALDALDQWSIVAAPELKPDPSNKTAIKKYKATLNGALLLVQALVDPLMDEWFQVASDDKEAEILESIRNAYLPEIILAYNDVLHYAGHAITRECLLDSLDLATKVASDDNVSKTILHAGRMTELVDSFAKVSLSILLSNEISKSGKTGSKKPRRSASRGGLPSQGMVRSLDIWQAKEGVEGGAEGVWQMG